MLPGLLFFIAAAKPLHGDTHGFGQHFQLSVADMALILLILEMISAVTAIMHVWLSVRASLQKQIFDYQRTSWNVRFVLRNDKGIQLSCRRIKKNRVLFGSL